MKWPGGQACPCVSGQRHPEADGSGKAGQRGACTWGRLDDLKPGFSAPLCLRRDAAVVRRARVFFSSFSCFLHGGSLWVGGAKGRMEGCGAGVVGALPQGPCWVPRRVGLAAGVVKSHRRGPGADWLSALQRFVSAARHASSRSPASCTTG